MKYKYLEVIEYVAKKRGEIEEISEIFNHVENMIDFDYHNMMRFVESKQSSKLGGRAVQLNKAIRFLKEELKKTYRKNK